MRKLSLLEAGQAHTAVDCWALSHLAPVLESIVHWARLSCPVSAGHSRPQYNLSGESVNRGPGVGGGVRGGPSWGRETRAVTACVYSACTRQAGAVAGRCKHPGCLFTPRLGRGLRQAGEPATRASWCRLGAGGSLIDAQGGGVEPGFTEHLVYAKSCIQNIVSHLHDRRPVWSP